MRQIIFNVGGAFSTYLEYNGNNYMIDLGKSSEFNPVVDFLIPLFRDNNYIKNRRKNWKYNISQLIISHPHYDHISSIIDFNHNIEAELLTTPNNNSGIDARHVIDWSEFDNNDCIAELKKMLNGRTPPNRPYDDTIEKLYFHPAKFVQFDDELKKESYCNNISIAVSFDLNNHRLLILGDLQKVGIEKLIENDEKLKYFLNDGVDILITPHHGLISSFSNTLFENMKNGKTRCLNIISEKVNSEDNRVIDNRYSLDEYCEGISNLKKGNEKRKRYRTSNGHLLIDYSNNDHPFFTIIRDKDELLYEFIKLKDKQNDLSIL